MRQRWNVLKVRSSALETLPRPHGRCFNRQFLCMHLFRSFAQGLLVLIFVGVVALPLLRPIRRTVVIREMGADGEWVRDHQVQDDLSPDEIGLRARAILGRKPTALEADKGPSNVRNVSDNQPSPSEAETTTEEPSVPVSTEGEVPTVEEKEEPTEEEELVENTYSKFKVKIVSGRYLAEVYVNDEKVSERTRTHTFSQ